MNEKQEKLFKAFRSVATDIGAGELVPGCYTFNKIDDKEAGKVVPNCSVGHAIERADMVEDMRMKGIHRMLADVCEIPMPNFSTGDTGWIASLKNVTLTNDSVFSSDNPAERLPEVVKAISDFQDVMEAEMEKAKNETDKQTKA